MDLSGPPLVMAVVNVTDDSFYVPSRGDSTTAVERALRAEAEGAAIVDFGGESTRPGAAYVDEALELARVVPAVREFRRRSDLPISVDTRKSAVARAALDAGADMVNDVSALRDDAAMASLCADRRAAVVLMHAKGASADMQKDPRYDDVVAEVLAFLADATDRALRAGIAVQRIVVDPGIGFGKRLEDNLDLIARLEELTGLGYPVLVGVSRKAFVGAVTGREPEDRLAGTLGADAAAIARGAALLRVHDVAPTVDMIKVLYAIDGRSGSVVPRER